MSSPPATSPPSSVTTGNPKRRISLTVQQGPATKKPKHPPSRKNSSVHPLRQTSFPPPESGTQYLDPGSPSIASIASGLGGRNRENESVTANGGGVGVGGATLEDEEDEGRDDYGTETVLADGGLGGFEEDDAEKRKMAILLEAFDDEQNQRYEAFRRANLNKAAVKKLANQVLSQSVTQNVGTVICGFSKVFSGEIIELALQIQKVWGHDGPLQPDHLREAWRRYKIEMQGAVGFRGVVGGGSPGADGGGPGVGAGLGGGVGRLFR
ncbi:hTAFII28-like protein conserved region-domain-containing protein [Geopyxis carbonaria]|nr:hTAFII28-like protein conserved region-domain-containing protein [Geopyxis carbonaria]